MKVPKGPFLEVHPVLVPPNALLLASPSKSATHRAILIGALTPHTVIENPLVSEDTLASLRLAETIGARTSAEPATETGKRLLGTVGRGLVEAEALDPDGHDADADVPRRWACLPLSPLLAQGRVPRPLLAAQVRLHVERSGPKVRIRSDTVDVMNSGTTLRLGTALAALGDTDVRLDGDASLRTRPMGPLLDALAALNAEVSAEGTDARPPVHVRGPLKPGRTELSGEVSSQFVSALLVAAQAIDGPTEVALTTPPRSAPYIRLTIETLARFGGVVEERKEKGAKGPIFAVPGPRPLRATRYVVPGDWSSAAFPLVAAAVTGGRTILAAMERDGPQGDRAVLDVLEATGCTVTWEPDPERAGAELLSVSAPVGPLKPFEHGFADTPDLFPALAVLAARTDGTSRLYDAAHVRLKECDRVAAMAEVLDAVGVPVEEEKEALIVHGAADRPLRAAILDTRDDHRILMAAAVLGLVGPGPFWLSGPASYHVSYPRFRMDLDALGGESRVVDEAEVALDATEGAA